MKKKIILAALVLFIVIALATTVKAATEVTTIEELKDALVGTEEIIQVKNDITDSTSKLKLEVTGTKVLDLDGNTIKLDKSYFVVTGDAALTVNGNGKVETTVTRAKETRSIAEKMITLGKGVFSGENKLVLKSNCGLRVLLARLE